MSKHGMGWIPDYPDVQTPKLRDYHEAIAERIRINQKKLQQDPTGSVQTRISSLEQSIKILEAKLNKEFQDESPTAEQHDRTQTSPEAERRIEFLLSNYEPLILSRGMQGRNVEELQRNLQLLGYYKEGDRSGYFGIATEKSVRQFQKHQNFDPSGVVSPVMWAELTALAEIATNELQRIFYEDNCGPGILYIEQQLQQIARVKNHVEIPLTGCLSGTTLDAIHAFQSSESFVHRLRTTNSQEEKDAVGPVTRRALREELASQLKELASQLKVSQCDIIPSERPLSAKTFEAVQICLYKFLYESQQKQTPETQIERDAKSSTGAAQQQSDRIEEAIADALGGKEAIKKYLRNTNPKYENSLEEQIKQRIAPLVEVIARLIQGNWLESTEKDSPKPGQNELPASVKFTKAIERWLEKTGSLQDLQPLVETAFDELQRVYHNYRKNLRNQQTSNNQSSSDNLKEFIDWVANGRGYFASYPLRFNQIYKRGLANAAVTYLQGLLHALGFYNAPITGVFEKLTEEALKKFQKQEEIDVDGIVGLDTRAKLADYKREKFYFLKSTISPAIAAEVLMGLGDYPAILHVEETLQELMSLNQEEITDFDKLAASYKNLSKSLSEIRSAIQQSQSLKYASSGSFDAVALAKEADSSLTRLIEGLTQGCEKIESGGIPSAQSVDLDTLPGRLRQLALFYIEVMLYPLIVAVSQLLAPIGIYATPSQGVAVGLWRFKQIAQQLKLEEIVQQEVTQPSSTCQPEYFSPFTKIWRRQFQAFIASRKLQPQTPLALEDETLSEFKPLVEQAIAQTFQCCSVALKKTLQTFLYQDLINLLEDFQHSFQWQAKTVDQPGDTLTLAELTKNILQKIIPSSHQLPEEEQHVPTSSPFAERTFVRLEISQPGKESLAMLQSPVTGKLYDHIMRSAPKQPNQKQCTIYLGLPEFVDLSQWCSPVRDQGTLDACTAHAGVALAEFFEKKSSEKATPLSIRFLYKVTRLLMQQTGNSGASIRETMKALVYFGVPPEQYCPYDEAKFDDDPDAFCYAFAQNYQTISYFRLDDPMLRSDELLAQIKTVLAAGFPCMFGFSVYDSLSSTHDPTGHILYPTPNSEREGGHAAIAVGYNDYKCIPGLDRPGAFLIQNSWGKEWGCQGYGWLPYDYVRCGLAQDWWSMIKTKWVEKSAFGLGFWDVDMSNSGTNNQGENEKTQRNTQSGSGGNTQSGGR